MTGSDRGLSEFNNNVPMGYKFDRKKRTIICSYTEGVNYKGEIKVKMIFSFSSPLLLARIDRVYAPVCQWSDQCHKQ